MSSTSQSTATRWILLGFLTLLNVVSFVDRQIISSLQIPIMKELGFTGLAIGLLSGYAFATFYSIMGLYLGILADRINRIKLIAVGSVSLELS
jgi:predicted MFS family arabinose efflux permease